MNTVADIRAFFVGLINEPSTSFMDTTRINSFLALGFSKWRKMVVDLNEELLERSVDITLVNARSYDLALAANPVRLMGATPTSRAANLLYLEQIDSSDETVDELRIVRSRKELQQVGVNEALVYFSGTTLSWPKRVSGTYRIFYVPSSIVDWTVDATIPSDFVEFHDVVAYLAYDTYAAHDQAYPRSLKEERDARVAAFEDFLQQGFVTDSHDDVSFEPNW